MYIHDALKEYVEEQREPEKKDLIQMRARAAKKIEKASEYNEKYVNKNERKQKNVR